MEIYLTHLQFLVDNDVKYTDLDIKSSDTVL